MSALSRALYISSSALGRCLGFGATPRLRSNVWITEQRKLFSLVEKLRGDDFAERKQRDRPFLFTRNPKKTGPGMRGLSFWSVHIFVVDFPAVLARAGFLATDDQAVQGVHIGADTGDNGIGIG